MKYDENLRMVSDGNDDDSPNATRVTIGSAASGAGNNSDSSTDGTDGNNSARGTGGTIDDGSAGTPHGSPDAARRNDPYRSRSGSGRNRRNRGGNSGDSGSANSGARKSGATEEGAGQTGDAIPREIAYDKLGKTGGGKSSAIKNAALSQEFLAEGWAILFDGLAVLFRDPEWKIEKDEDGAELAERTLNWARSLDGKRSKDLEKWLAKWQPFLMLLMALFAIVGPRFAHTRSKRRAFNLQAQRASGTGASETATPVAGSSNSAATATASEPADNRGTGPRYAHERPFRRQDFAEVFGANDA